MSCNGHKGMDVCRREVVVAVGGGGLIVVRERSIKTSGTGIIAEVVADECPGVIGGNGAGCPGFIGSNGALGGAHRGGGVGACLVVLRCRAKASRGIIRMLCGGGGIVVVVIVLLLLLLGRGLNGFPAGRVYGSVLVGEAKSFPQELCVSWVSFPSKSCVIHT